MNDNPCFEKTNFLGCFLSMGVAAVVSAFVGNLWIGLLVYICMTVIAVIIDIESLSLHMSYIIYAFFIFLFTSEEYDNYIQTKENATSHLEAIRNSDKLPQKLKNQIAANPFLSVTNEMEQKEADMQTLIFETDSMVNTMRQKKSPELTEVRNQYCKKSKILHIKKLWLNSDTKPWTYSSWKRIGYDLSVKKHIPGNGRNSYFNGTVTPNIQGESTYIGENKLDYVNIIFSDNSYQRYLIKDAPEWLFAKEGQQVKLCYNENENFSEKDISFTNVITNSFDLIFTKQYVPLFK